MNNTQIESGDYVQHVNPLVNGGLRMTVEDTNENDEALVSYFTGAELTHKSEWVSFNELKLVQKADGGFIDL